MLKRLLRPFFIKITMKRILLYFLLLLLPGIAHAQCFSETIALATDKTHYAPDDTLYASGILFSPDAVSSSSLSRYCMLEIISPQGEVVRFQKVRCEHSVFHARIPLAGLPPADHWLVRAYTRFMRNFEPTSWPMQVVGINRPRQYPVILERNDGRAGKLQLSLIQNTLAYQYVSPDTLSPGGSLSFYAGGKKLAEVPLRKERGLLLLPADSLPGALIHGMAEDAGGNLLDVQSVSSAASASFRLQTDTLRVESNGRFGFTLTAGSESLCLLVRLEKEGLPLRHPLHQSMKAFRQGKAHAYRQVLTGQYPYRFVPEQVLSLDGTVETEAGNTFRKGGILVAFNNDTGFTYTGDIAKDGTFRVGVDDFKEESSFFLQAYNLKGKSNFYRITPSVDTHPAIHLPAIAWEDSRRLSAANTEMKVDTVGTHWIPEVTVRSFLPKEDTPSRRFYQTNYVEREEIEKEGLVTLESILRRMPGIRLQRSEDSHTFAILTTRGSGVLREGNGVNINLDGSWIESDNGYLNLETVVDPMDIETVEYIPATAALKYGVKAFNGVIAITTRSGKGERPAAPSRGIHFRPTGLSDNRPFPEHVPLRSLYLQAGESRRIQWRAPLYAGNYYLVIEAIGESRHIVLYKKQKIQVDL